MPYMTGRGFVSLHTGHGGPGAFRSSSFMSRASASASNPALPPSSLCRRASSARTSCVRILIARRLVREPSPREATEPLRGHGLTTSLVSALSPA